MQGLIDDGFVSTKDDRWYILTEQGYEYIYKNYTVKDTEELIMSVFRKHKKGIGEPIMSNSFLSLQQDMERFHFDNYGLAFQNLIEGNFIELVNDRLYKLTKDGYDRIR
ncbi:MAG: hypothetical protein FWD66_07445 [Paludibacter sp.]|nr:hypothetical protein [Paludibacter sp.]